VVQSSGGAGAQAVSGRRARADARERRRLGTAASSMNTGPAGGGALPNHGGNSGLQHLGGERVVGEGRMDKVGSGERMTCGAH
jgi:hypothetical protein